MSTKIPDFLFRRGNLIVIGDYAGSGEVLEIELDIVLNDPPYVNKLLMTDRLLTSRQKLFLSRILREAQSQ